MSITKITAWLAGSGFLLISLFASTSANAGILVPGIVDPSLPQFVHNVKIRANRGNWTLQTNNGLKDFQLLGNNGEIYQGDGFKYNFSAQFADGGVSGTMSIQGSMLDPIFGITDKKTTLMSANLTAFGSNLNGSIIGFTTDNIFCDPRIEAVVGLCTQSESIILTVDDLFSGDPLARYHTTAGAQTSVPLPAAVWLFGSGIGLMGVIARRRKKS
jgi:hypothetical protein